MHNCSTCGSLLTNVPLSFDICICYMAELSLSWSLNNMTWSMGKFTRNALSGMLEKAELKIDHWSFCKNFICATAKPTVHSEKIFVQIFTVYSQISSSVKLCLWEKTIQMKKVNIFWVFFQFNKIEAVATTFSSKVFVFFYKCSIVKNCPTFLYFKKLKLTYIAKINFRRSITNN